MRSSSFFFFVFLQLSFVRGQDIAAGGFQVVREDGDIGHDDN